MSPASPPVRKLITLLSLVLVGRGGNASDEFLAACHPAGNCAQPPSCECLNGNISDLAIFTALPANSLQHNWTTLDVSYNSITVIHSYTFNSTSFSQTITGLYLENNEIASVEDNAFAALTGLNVLSLKNNPLNYVSTLALNVSSLKTLSLENCLLTDLEENMLKYLFNLNHLNLNKNKIKAIPADLFQPMRLIEELNLEDNRIRSLSNKTFQGLLYLKTINLKKNKIRYFEPGLFSSVPQLKTINVESNKLKLIEMRTINELVYNLNESRLFYSYDLLLSNNSWDCADCLLTQVFGYCRNLTRLGDKCGLHIVCATPAKYHNMSWDQVDVALQLSVGVCSPVTQATTTMETVATMASAEPVIEEAASPEIATRDAETLTVVPSTKTIGVNAPNCSLSNMNTTFDLSLCSVKSEPSSDADVVITETMCVFQYYFLVSYAIFVLIVACTVWVIIYRVKLSEVLDEDLYF